MTKTVYANRDKFERDTSDLELEIVIPRDSIPEVDRLAELIEIMEWTNEPTFEINVPPAETWVN